MAPSKRYAPARRRQEAGNVAAQPGWSRQASRSRDVRLPRESQILRGLLLGLPLGMTVWLILVLAIWWIA